MHVKCVVDRKLCFNRDFLAGLYHDFFKNKNKKNNKTTKQFCRARYSNLGLQARSLPTQTVNRRRTPLSYGNCPIIERKFKVFKPQNLVNEPYVYLCKH